MPERTLVKVGGRKLEVSNLDKVLYPEAGFTKGAVIDYYVQVSEVLLPHLRNRPLTLKRYPEGVDRPHFYEKQCPSHRPRWLRTVEVFSEGRGRRMDYCLANDLASLVWAANLADLELHTRLSRVPRLERPTMVVFDLDPGAPATIVECCQVAMWLKEVLDEFGLMAFPKTSGSKGLQVYVPLNSPVTFEETKPFAKAMAELLTKEHPELVVSRMLKRLRKGKVLVDWSQNDESKTTVCAYSLRAKAQPTVSTPVTWEEVEACLKDEDPDVLSFTAADVLQRLEAHGDLFAPVLKLKQRLTRVQ